jgi:DnaJ-domain-containing protein 1
MSHLTMDQLVALRDRGREPGDSGAQAHLDGCAACTAELQRMDQRIARLKALPSLAPSRSQWPVVSRQLAVRRRRQVVRWAAITGLAAAAGFAVMVTARSGEQHSAAEQVALDEAMARSRQLEQLIQSYNPDARVTDGRTVRMASTLENRISDVDQQLEVVQLQGGRHQDQAMLRLWRQRVGLLDALVDVHVTRASAVGF